jgi:hypothetical protein
MRMPKPMPMVEPSCNDQDDISEEACGLGGRCHVAREVRAQLRVLVALEIREADDREGANRGRDQMDEETD